MAGVVVRQSAIQQLGVVIPAGMATEEQTLLRRLTETEDKSAAVHDEFVSVVSGIKDTEAAVRRELLYAAQKFRQPERPKKRKRQQTSDSESPSEDDSEDQEIVDDAETYRTAAAQFSKISEVLGHLQKRLADLQDENNDHKRRLLENHKRYKANRDEWFASMQRLTQLSDRIDDTTVVSLLSSVSSQSLAGSSIAAASSMSGAAIRK